MNVNSLVRTNVQKMKAYSSARSEFKGQADIFLDANECPFDTGLNRYPDPLQWQLKNTIGKLKNIAPENIFLGNGSDEVIDLLIRIFCEPKTDEIIVLPPSYGMYEVSAALSDVVLRKINLTEDFQPDVSAILNGVKPNSKILFLCSPNNPTGNSFDKIAIEQLLKSFRGIVVVDEAYVDFSNQTSCLEMLNRFSNLIVMQTFSKSWGLAGIRLGMAFASTEIIQLLNKVKPPYNINQLTQQVALNALEKKEQKEEWVQQIKEERNRLAQLFQEIEFVQKVYPSDANFLLLKVEAPNQLYNYLVKKKIIVRNRSTVILCEGCLRISVGTKAENEQLLTALYNYKTNLVN